MAYVREEILFPPHYIQDDFIIIIIQWSIKYLGYQDLVWDGVWKMHKIFFVCWKFLIDDIWKGRKNRLIKKEIETLIVRLSLLTSFRGFFDKNVRHVLKLSIVVVDDISLVIYFLSVALLLNFSQIISLWVNVNFLSGGDFTNFPPFWRRLLSHEWNFSMNIFKVATRG